MTGFLLFLGVFAGIQVISYYGHKSKNHRAYTLLCTPPKIEEGNIVFKGRESGIDTEKIHKILLKRFPYYALLDPSLQCVFRERLQAFMHSKTFIIKDDEGFKEMPVLISATAIQLTLGLKEFLLPFYQYIRIYPQEYFAEHAFFTVLAGNVKENIITVAWNHLLTGLEKTDDGANLGLHEMSHALYRQRIIIDEGYANDFSRKYQLLVGYCNQAHKEECKGEENLYSEYADNNLQEFWAETVELFFEKPDALQNTYPEVFDAMALLLNQNPIKKQNPLMSNNHLIKNRLFNFRTRVRRFIAFT